MFIISIWIAFMWPFYIEPFYVCEVNLLTTFEAVTMALYYKTKIDNVRIIIYHVLYAFWSTLNIRLAQSMVFVSHGHLIFHCISLL